MVDRATLTRPDIAARYSRALDTVAHDWAERPEFPAPVGKSGKWLLYDAAQVAAFVREHIAPPTLTWEPDRLYATREIADRLGITVETINTDKARGRWPAADGKIGRSAAWYGTTIEAVLAARPGRGRTA